MIELLESTSVFDLDSNRIARRPSMHQMAWVEQAAHEERRPWDTLRAPVVSWRAGKATHVVSREGWRLASSEEWIPSNHPLRDAILDCNTKQINGVVELDPVTDNPSRLPIGGAIFHYGEWAEWYRPTWDYEGGPRVVIRPLRGTSERPLIEGFAWQYGYGEVWVIGCDLTTEDGASYVIGSQGPTGVIRLKDCNIVRPVDPDQQQEFGGTGIFSAIRTSQVAVHLEDVKFVGAVQQHDLYADNPWFIACVRTIFGPAGRTHMQAGTRLELGEIYGLPSRWLGILILDCEGYGLNSGNGGGSGLTVWGYPGRIQINGFKLVSDSTGALAKNRAISIWKAQNYETIDPEGDGYSNDHLVVRGVVIDYPGMQRGAFEFESTRVAIIGDLEGNCPKWTLDAPDMYVSGYVGTLRKIPGTNQHGLEINWTRV